MTKIFLIIASVFSFYFLSITNASPDCRQGVRCKGHGECTLKNGLCIPGSESDCRESDFCQIEGRCSFQNGACVALKNEDCKMSQRCKEIGMCNARASNCAPASDADCKESVSCAKYRRCVLYERKLTNLPSQYSCVRSKEAAIAGENETNCKTAGGRWMGEIRGRGRMTGCLLPTTDKGKACTDSSECESVCVNFKCYESSDFRGCGLVEKGKVICID